MSAAARTSVLGNGDGASTWTVATLTAAAAESFGRAPFVDSAPAHEIVGYADLYRWSRRFTSMFERFDVPVGASVLLAHHNSAMATTAYVSTMCAGRVAVMLNPLAGQMELRHAIEVTQPALLVMDAPAARRWALGSERLRTVALDSLDDLEVAVGTSEAELPAIDPSSGAEVVFTSGSTGRPKAALLSHANLVSNARALAVRYGAAEGDRFLAVSPLFHNSGQVFPTLAPMFVGGITVPARTDMGLARFGRIVDSHRISWTLVVNAFLTVANAKGNGPREMRMKGVLAGGSVLTSAVIEEFERTYGSRVYQVYGLTETTSVSTSEVPDDAETRSIGSAGVPLPHVKIDIDPASGEILVSGPHVFLGYVNDPGATVARLHDGVLRTGDVGSWDERGNLHITDRLDNMLIVGGENVYPAEVEHIADAFTGVTGSIAVGLDDALLGHRIVLVYEGRPELKDELWAHLRRNLSALKSPATILCSSELGLDAFPRAANGKLLRTEVMSIASQHASDGGSS